MFSPHLSTLTEYSIIYFSGETYFYNFNIILMMYLYNTLKNNLNQQRIKEALLCGSILQILTLIGIDKNMLNSCKDIL